MENFSYLLCFFSVFSIFIAESYLRILIRLRKSSRSGKEWLILICFLALAGLLFLQVEILYSFFNQGGAKSSAGILCMIPLFNTASYILANYSRSKIALSKN